MGLGLGLGIGIGTEMAGGLGMGVGAHPTRAHARDPRAQGTGPPQGTGQHQQRLPEEQAGAGVRDLGGLVAYFW